MVEELRIAGKMNLFAIFPIGTTMQDGGKRKRSDGMPKLQPVTVYLNSYILFQFSFYLFIFLDFILFLCYEEAHDYGHMTYHIILYYRP